MSERKNILVVGDAIIDRHWYCTPKGVSPEAPILSWDVDEVINKVGGAANVVANLCTLTTIHQEPIDIDFISVVPPEFLTYVPIEFPTANLIVTPRSPTVKNRIIFKNPHQQIVRFDEDNNTPLGLQHQAALIKRIREKRYDIGVISDYSHGGVNREVVAAVREQCDLVVCDPKGVDSSKYNSLVDILTPNLQELKDLVPSHKAHSLHSNITNLADTIEGHRCEPTTIILKLGEKGCITYSTNKGFGIEPCYRNGREVIDPTGAGDTFIATLSFELSRGAKLEKAVRSATRLAGISVTYPTCWVPTEEECLKRQSE